MATSSDPVNPATTERAIRADHAKVLKRSAKQTTKSLREALGTLREQGVEVLWSETIDCPAVWSEKHSLLVLGLHHDRAALDIACWGALDELRPRKQAVR